MEPQTIEAEKFTSALDDLVNIFIEHDFTVKEAQIFLQSSDILCAMMDQFIARDADLARLRKVTHPPEHVLGFIKEECPTYAFLLDSIDHREIEKIFFTLMQRREIYDRYKIWCGKKSMRPLHRVPFYETLQSLKFRVHPEKPHDLHEKAQRFSGGSSL